MTDHLKKCVYTGFVYFCKTLEMKLQHSAVKTLSMEKEPINHYSLR